MGSGNQGANQVALGVEPNFAAFHPGQQHGPLESGHQYLCKLLRLQAGIDTLGVRFQGCADPLLRAQEKIGEQGSTCAIEVRYLRCQHSAQAKSIRIQYLFENIDKGLEFLFETQSAFGYRFEPCLKRRSIVFNERTGQIRLVRELVMHARALHPDLIGRGSKAQAMHTSALHRVGCDRFQLRTFFGHLTRTVPATWRAV